MPRSFSFQSHFLLSFRKIGANLMLLVAVAPSVFLNNRKEVIQCQVRNQVGRLGPYPRIIAWSNLCARSENTRIAFRGYFRNQWLTKAHGGRPYWAAFLLSQIKSVASLYPRAWRTFGITRRLTGTCAPSESVKVPVPDGSRLRDATHMTLIR